MLFNTIYFFYVIFTNLIKYTFWIQDYNQTIILILEELGKLNIIFAKIFQWSFLDENNHNNYLITKEIYQYVFNYTTNTPYDTDDIDYKSLIEIYNIAKQNNDNIIIENIKPINSGTISLIFKAKLNDKPVVIKLLRKDIKKKIIDGIKLLKIIGYIISFIPNVNLFMLDKIIEKNKNNFYLQVDFLNEINNIELFYNSLEKNKFIIVPKVYEYYTKTNTNIIVMDFINGNKINELSKEEKINFILPLAKLTKNCLFIKKIMHCDLHQGNILFIKQENEGIFSYNKFIDFVDYLLDDNNIEYYFESTNILNLQKLKNNILNEQKINNFFYNPKLDYVISDIYKFLQLLKDNNCKISKNIHKILLAIIPLFTVIVGLGNDEKNNYIIINEFKKFNLNNMINSL